MSMHSPPLSSTLQEHQRALFKHNTQAPSPPPSPLTMPTAKMAGLQLDNCSDESDQSSGDCVPKSRVVYECPNWLQAHLTRSKELSAEEQEQQQQQQQHGGKDSFYNLMQCVANGHTIIALGNLHPPPQDKKDELDSYMYQTVGHDVIHLYQECLGIPLYRQVINGTPVEQNSDYVKTEMDETEDLFTLLASVKEKHPDLEAVSVGAILSNYQRIRVENICARLGLVALSYLWQRNQEELLQEMAQAGVNAVLIKIAAMGLKKQHLGRSIGDMFPYLCQMNQEFDLHICGEGGEYETITLDCPLFKKRIVVDESEIVIHSDDAFAQVAYLRFKKVHVEDKSEDDMNADWISDMNLDPVWNADSITLPIQDVVRASQGHEAAAIETLASGYVASDDEQVEENLYRPKYHSHSSPTVCAIGATTAYDNLLVHGNRYMSIAEETTACLRNMQ
ncbi:ATP binding domain 4, partial [Podila epigama]